jgi:hypothetical protein
MAFPGTYNFNYYKGDTFEFNIYPKISSGAYFDLTDYGSAEFVLAPSRGSSGVSGQIEALAEIKQDGVDGPFYITCTIIPGTGRNLDASITYVYDVQVTKPGTPAIIHTLLTGTVTVTEDVAGAV